jgi:uncharacterized RDD family membrane protein YckC
MKTSSSSRFLPAALGLFVAAATLFAQEPPTPKSPPAVPAADNPPSVATPPAPATAPAPDNARAAATAPAPTTEAAPAAPTPPEVAPAPAEAAPAPEKPKEENGDLRRIDRGPRRRGGGQFPFGDHTVAKDSRISEAVSIFGSTTVEGDVASDAVSILGDTRIAPDAKVGGGAVAVLGRTENRGTVRGEVVSVLGGVLIDGPVHGDVVSVLGNMELGPKAVIDGDLVLVGGKLTKAPEAVVHGDEVRVPIFGPVGNLEWLTTWFRRCLLLGRPLAFGPNLAWAWAVAFSFLAFYLLLALLFPRGIVKCAETLETRPGSSIVASVLTVLLTPVAIVLLAITVIGAVLVPFVAAALLVAGLFGKAVMLGWLGRRFTKYFGDGPLGHPVFAVLIGGLLVMLLYTVYGSFVLYKLMSWLGLGVVVYTIMLRMKREKAPAAAGVAPASPDFVPPATSGVAETIPPSGGATGVVAGETIGAASQGFVGAATEAAETTGGVATATPPPISPRPAVAAMPAVPATSLPRAEFFIRVAALLLDVVLVGVVVAFLNGPLPRPFELHFSGFMLALATYGAVMWKTKGTTIGGIVCSLKVVRVDNREIDWATAIVRALSCFLSMIVVGLGFIWIAIDDDKQSWHDKIAGTAVVRVPKGVSLL